MGVFFNGLNERMLMFVNIENGFVQGQIIVLEKESVYVFLFDKINLILVISLGDINVFLDDVVLFDVLVGECLIVVMQVFMDCICKFGQLVEKFDKILIDYYIVELDF